MKKISNTLGALGSAAVLLFVACGIISGTWVISFKVAENEDLNWEGEFYYSEVDMSKESDWEDNKEHLKDVDLVGFELWATNNVDEDKLYRVYAAPGSSDLVPSSSLSAVEAGATLILDDVPLAASTSTYVTYGNSFKYLKNFDQLVTYIEDGNVKFFSMEAGGATNTDLHIDSLLVVVTFTAGL